MGLEKNEIKRVAIVTGASGGIGKEFAKLLVNENVDEVWAIARNEAKLLSLKEELGNKIIPISKDLTKREDLYSLEEIIKNKDINICYLINNAGLARMGSYDEFTIAEIEDTINLNCTVLTSLCRLCIPYMQKRGRILNISSASSFQPLPYLSLYGATKVFEKSYSRALNVELKGEGITVTAVCPSWVDTELLLKEVNGKKVDFPGIVSAERVAIKGLKDAKKGKDLSVCTFYVKYLHVIGKLLPERFVMWMWMKGIKKYIE